VADVFDTPIGVVVGSDAAASVNGQLATLALVNQLARVHRHISLQIPSTPLLRPALVLGQRLDEAAEALARDIDPFIRIERGATPYAVGLGGAAAGTPWYAGASGQVAVIDRRPVGLDGGDQPSLGAALAACLAAANLLRQVLGHAVRVARISAWDCSDGEIAAAGPTLAGPLDVGSVLQVGAGGVGSCLDYWLREFGVVGHWRVADRDTAALHNTNRSLGMLARDAGWPVGVTRNKAAIAADLFGGEALPAWYDELDLDGIRPDLVLPLANERDVRSLIAARGEPILLHATTSRTWEAQVHRHIAGRDDCIVCRMPDAESQVRFGCSTVSLSSASSQSSDAALPFLSATAGLLLLSALYRLQYGVLAEGRHNLCAVCFNDLRRLARRSALSCNEGCAVLLGRSIRERIHAGRQWSHLDHPQLPLDT
jgi:hypothetical protein